jgi:hypothetical protein
LAWGAGFLGRGVGKEAGVAGGSAGEHLVPELLSGEVWNSRICRTKPLASSDMIQAAADGPPLGWLGGLVNSVSQMTKSPPTTTLTGAGECHFRVRFAACSAEGRPRLGLLAPGSPQVAATIARQIR